MASHHGKPHSEPVKQEQIITEFFAKSLHIILDSRCPYPSSRNYSVEQFLFSPSPSSSSSSSSSCPPRDKWFNLALRDCPVALENIDFWRQINIEPMVVDIVLMQRPIDWDPLSVSPKGGSSSGKEWSCGSDFDVGGFGGKREKIIERWVIQYESKESSRRSSGSTSSHTLYKKSMLLLRSLYATVRLLPAYKLFRDLIASAQIRLYNIGHRISSFVEPFTRRDETDMRQFEFSPVETSCGRLCLSVCYQASSVLDVNSEPSTPISPQFITEYVGSPLAEPLKRIPSGPVSRISTFSSPFDRRRHSWSNDLNRGVSPPSLNPSPSPTYSEPHASISKQHHPHPPVALPRQLQYGSYEANLKIPSHDEYWLSPPFSASPPSPPTCSIDGDINKAFVRCESAPVSIRPRFSTIPPLPPNHQMNVPSPPIGGSRFAFCNEDAGFHRTISAVAKLGGSKDESGSSGRLSFQDDYDDDVMNPFSSSRDHLLSGVVVQARKSQDSAVSALVHMLKKAPPLHQQQQQQQQSPTGASKNFPSNVESLSPTSGSSASKTTAEALEELRAYSEMKAKLLNQSKTFPGIGS